MPLPFLPRKTGSHADGGGDYVEPRVFGKALCQLWTDRTAALDGGTRTFLYGFCERLREATPAPPATIEDQRAACVRALGAILDHELPLAAGPWTAYQIHGMMDSVGMVRQLGAFELHAACCEMLLGVRAAEVAEWAAGRPVAGLRPLRDLLADTLAGLPPDHIPEFWSRLADPAVSDDLLPVAARMRSRDAVPHLVASLGNLAPDGQAAVVGALQAIGDARAVPALRALAQEPGALAAPIAERAVHELLAHSADDSARLLRAAHPVSAAARDTLLRPAAAGLPTAADELLRPTDRGGAYDK